MKKKSPSEIQLLSCLEKRMFSLEKEFLLYFERLMSHAISAHASKARKPSKAFRKWDEKTPYSVHPIWCAAMILSEPSLPQDIRERGALALLLHDVLEDTTAGLPKGCPTVVARLVDEMTFSSSDEEMEKVWERPAEVRLLKLFDKVSNLLDGVWMSPEKRVRYVAYTLRLADDVEANYGRLNVVRIARAIIASGEK